MQKPRVLVVEDSPTQALQIRLLLEADGFLVDGVSCLYDAVEFVATVHVDVIALDLMLPDSSGLEALEQMIKVAVGTPIVVLTAHADEGMAIEALSRGAEDYLFKGQFDQPLLVRTMRYAIERHRIRMQLEDATNALRAKNAELARMDEEKNRFLGIAAHDLRNPLGVILGYTELLLAGDAGEISEEQQEILSVVGSSVEFMLALINDLLDISTIQTGGARLDLRPVDIVELASHNVAMNQVLAGKKNIRLVFESRCQLEPLVLDRRKIEQLLNNLLSNAIKFSHKGTKVEVRIDRQGDNAIISVIDQGVGIPSGEVDKLFRPFQKTSVRTTGGERSTGLGLAIVRNIVERHHGRIWCESEVGRGSTFHVSLPIK